MRCSCLNVVSRAGEPQQGLFNNLEGEIEILFLPHATVAIACSSITQLYPDRHPVDLASGSLSYLPACRGLVY